ncbi:MAG: hypothetical protein B7Y45_01595 [Sphingomonas sp. 28-66-16]|nr:MAG: hypothetical protein B7Y45_01595 [Sphingomonas sp. 28-66-16]
MIARLVPLARLAVALLLPVALASCILAPGKFTSTLRIDADRRFAFSYVGEVYAEEGDKALGGGLTAKDHDEATKDPATKRAEADARNRAVAAALAREAGYRRVEYLGEGKFMIDYAITGRLDHVFVWPYNIDAEVLFPFVAIELRQGGLVRVKAPAFGNEGGKSAPGMPDMGQAMASRLDGIFTLDTDAEIVSQNNEDGAINADGRRTIRWKATPLSRTAPAAVLKLAPPVS